ncbi:MAG: hypothetical protein ACLR3R_18665 [Clostridium paraputrificum]
MISQIKIQLNLYTHRDKDNKIIEALDLSNSIKPNDTVKEVLYNISTGQGIISTPSDKFKEENLSLQKTIEDLKEKIKSLETENQVYKKMILNQEGNARTESSATKETSLNNNSKSSKLNSKLKGSIKSLEI